MSSNFLKRIGICAGVLAGIVAAASIFTSRAQADSYDKMTLLTLDQPTQFQDTYLEPGTYMIKLVNSQSDRHIVQIFNRDRSHLFNTIIAIPSYRVIPTGETAISYWETPPGTARAVRDWFYPGDNDGQEFRYPRQLRQVAFAIPPPPAAPPAPPEAALTPEPAPPPPQAAVEPPPAPLAVAPEPQPVQPPVELAQNTPPPAPAPAPQPPSQPEEQTLPKTGSPYPLCGLGGLAALGLYAALRKTTA
jgi:hypothetical protein